MKGKVSGAGSLRHPPLVGKGQHSGNISWQPRLKLDLGGSVKKRRKADKLSQLFVGATRLVAYATRAPQRALLQHLVQEQAWQKHFPRKIFSRSSRERC